MSTAVAPNAHAYPIRNRGSTPDADYVAVDSNSDKDEPAPRSNTIDKEKYKTKLCRNFSQGHCHFASRCAFAHGAEDLRPQGAAPHTPQQEGSDERHASRQRSAQLTDVSRQSSAQSQPVSTYPPYYPYLGVPVDEPCATSTYYNSSMPPAITEYSHNSEESFMETTPQSESFSPAEAHESLQIPQQYSLSTPVTNSLVAYPSTPASPGSEKGSISSSLSFYRHDPYSWNTPYSHSTSQIREFAQMHDVEDSDEN